MAERAADLDDISQRVIAHLLKLPAPGVPDPGHPFVLVARDLAPADTATLDLDQVLGLVTVDGGPTSHTAILAREKSIVAIVGAADASGLADGDTVIVDAANSLVVFDPSADEIADATARIAERAALEAAPVTPGALADGTPVPLLANLGSADGAAEALRLGAEGVGLFRTEFLFLDADTAPSITDQQAQYTKMLTAFAGKKVVVRVLDAGADKPLSFLNDAAEENPALGLRGIRALRHSEVILREQLTALAAADAATDAELWVMAPMIATVDETRYFTALRKELGIRVAGVMVEMPSAALVADHVLAACDFASIGTNDLTQYTMAADRLLGTVAKLQDPWHPAVLRLIADVGRAGAELGKPVGICGEAAADPLLAVVLVGLGATSLSMSPSALADVRASLARYSPDDAKSLAGAALAAEGAAEAERRRRPSQPRSPRRANPRRDHERGTQMTTTSSDTKRPGGARVAVQKFGTFLSGMIMPNIAAFIAWGFITALFIEAGPFPVPELGGFPSPDGTENPGLVGPMITYLLPLLIANQGGRMVYDTRGGVVGTIATVGVIVGAGIPMFIGAMIMGPLAAWIMKRLDRLWEGKIKAGFEMLVNNFSAGILGMLLALVGFYAFAPAVEFLSNGLETAVNWLVLAGLLPLVSILVEPGKILFLNNAINHGVFTPSASSSPRRPASRSCSSSRRTPARASASCWRSRSSGSGSRGRARRVRSSSSSSAASTRSTSRTCS